MWRSKSSGQFAFKRFVNHILYTWVNCYVKTRRSGNGFTSLILFITCKFVQKLQKRPLNSVRNLSKVKKYNVDLVFLFLK